MLIQPKSHFPTMKNDYYCKGYDGRNLRWYINLFELFSCTCLYPNPKAWRLYRLEEVPSVLSGTWSASVAMRMSPMRGRAPGDVSLGIHLFFLETLEERYSHKEHESKQLTR